jgi:hypothetical protein
MRASLLAMATTTTFFAARASSASSQAPDRRPIPLDPQYRSPCPVDEDLAQVLIAVGAGLKRPKY